MIAGMATAAKALKPAIEVIGVETLRFPSMHAALNALHPQFGSTTIADGIAVREPGRLTFEIIRKQVDDVLLVDEGDIEEAMLLLLEIEKAVVEGAGAAGLAGLLRNRPRFAGKKVGIVLSGGNIDPLTLADIIERGMVRAGRLARLQVELRDLPGSLAQVTACLAEANANIEEVHHERAFSQLPVQSAVVDFVLQTRGHDHVRQLIAALEAAGFKARLHND
jgi:threonine dehydratase